MGRSLFYDSVSLAIIVLSFHLNFTRISLNPVFFDAKWSNQVGHHFFTMISRIQQDAAGRIGLLTDLALVILLEGVGEMGRNRVEAGAGSEPSF